MGESTQLETRFRILLLRKSQQWILSKTGNAARRCIYSLDHGTHWSHVIINRLVRV